MTGTKTGREREISEKSLCSTQRYTLLHLRQEGGSKKMFVMYHYTNEKGLDAIIKEGYISKSTDQAKDAKFGEGVYLTHLSQKNDKIAVAKNCWNQAYNSAIEEGKLNYAIRIEIPSKKLICAKDGTRVIYVYKGDLILQDYQHEFITCNWKNDSNNVLALLLAVGSIVTLGFVARKWYCT